MRVRWIFAAFAAVAITLGAVEARAQEACAVPEDVPPLVYEVYIEVLGPGFPIPEAACENLVKGAVSACHKAVTAAAKCWKGVGKGVGKGAKVMCKEQGEFQQECLDATASDLDGLAAEVESSSDAGHIACELESASFLTSCLIGVF